MLGRRERAGDAAGYDRIRAERELFDLDAELATARSERARAQSLLGAFFGSGDVTTLTAVVASPATRAALPSVEDLLKRGFTAWRYKGMNDE